MECLWKTCYHSDKYLISSNGLVKNYSTGLILKPQINSDGYSVISLTVNSGERKTFKIHRLVAELFCDNPENKETVNHIDGDKQNNCSSNLEWATRSEQVKHAWDNGLIKDLKSRKESIRQKQGKPVLCTTTGETWDSIGRAAEELGLKKSNISAVCLGKKGFKSAGKTDEGKPRKWRFIEMTEINYKLAAEVAVIKRLITQVYPEGIVSLVSDSYDFWSVITKVSPFLKDEILNRQHNAIGLCKTVFRPDSGNPVHILAGYTVQEVESLSQIEWFRVDVSAEVVFNKKDGKYYTVESNDNGFMTKFKFTEVPEHEVKGAVECLWDVFGGTETEKGYKLLNDKVGLIYGDSITLQRANEILSRLADKGFASGNVVFGVGSYTYQYLTRDSFGFAMKATYGEVDGVGREIFKDPATDSGTKKSAKGLLRVEKEDGEYVLYDQQTWEQEAQGELEEVFTDGKLVKRTSFTEIRNRLKEQG